MTKIITKSSQQTRELGEKLAKGLFLVGENFKSNQFENISPLEVRMEARKRGAIVLGLSGDLGSGKTTFLQGFAKGLGIKEKILSPTFVIQKRFNIYNPKFKNFYHIDCYRLEKEKDVLMLGWKEIANNPQNIIAIEWPEKIKKVLPKNIIWIKFKFIDDKTRGVNLKYRQKIPL